ncbi:hypothetical protein LOK49_LG07G01326 [Camellia lanceoleosa]|uniref:Uncharacterized protein n=1 Tax=Camellia lanceoleosa TaxID=1840588 RepID=A0ACC0H975_9ERIC|nr:hypothetical protein LOK49_LG07G01326 [Camellia lanceoleosa]
MNLRETNQAAESTGAGHSRISATQSKGPNRAFDDLVAASGITDAMVDSLTALKDLDGVQGLPPLKKIEDMRYLKNTRKSTRVEIERQKQEEVANAQVRQVYEKGRAYGTGRRKCSVARVWIQPGDGKFVVNNKEFDVYFPMLDHRAILLRPFSETKTLGLWDISCTVKGGGVTGLHKMSAGCLLPLGTLVDSLSSGIRNLAARDDGCSKRLKCEEIL